MERGALGGRKCMKIGGVLSSLLKEMKLATEARHKYFLYPHLSLKFMDVHQ